VGPFLAAALRALAVTLLLSTVLLPAADHHALPRLVGVVEGDAHWAQAHHHRAQGVRESLVERMAAAARAKSAIPFERLPGPPVVAPIQVVSDWSAEAVELESLGLSDVGRVASPVLVAAGAPIDALGFATLAANGAIVAFAVALLIARVAVALDRRPSAPWRRVPVPPPRAALLVTA
jgi:hypothetical protein